MTNGADSKPSRASYVKYKGDAAYAIRQRAKELVGKGLDRRAIYATLRAEKFKAPDGITPIRTVDLARTLRQLDLTASPTSLPAVVTNETKPREALKYALLHILTDPATSDQKKIKLLITYLED